MQMKAYQKILKKICKKCKETCCDYGLDPKIEEIFLKKNEKIKYGLIEKRNAKSHCLAYHNNSCLAYEYRPMGCRTHYCKKFDSLDKKIILLAGINESSIERIAKKIAFTKNKMQLDYLIFSHNPEQDAKIIEAISNIAPFIDKEESLISIEEFNKIRHEQVIVTSTAPEHFLSKTDLNSATLEDEILGNEKNMSAWTYLKEFVLSRDLAKIKL
ncbi:MAG: hypothetical protein PHS81_02260 [Candidatus Nanoarchaeia archaeon]|nr:hypothetical protein [Candidatus Nanoarchaeia archaeon]